MARTCTLTRVDAPALLHCSLRVVLKRCRPLQSPSLEVTRVPRLAEQQEPAFSIRNTPLTAVGKQNWHHQRMLRVLWSGFTSAEGQQMSAATYSAQCEHNGMNSICLLCLEM